MKIPGESAVADRSLRILDYWQTYYEAGSCGIGFIKQELSAEINYDRVHYRKAHPVPLLVYFTVKKGSKIFERTSSGTPLPVFSTAISANWSSAIDANTRISRLGSSMV